MNIVNPNINFKLYSKYWGFIAPLNFCRNFPETIDMRIALTANY